MGMKPPLGLFFSTKGRVRWSGPADQPAPPPHNNQPISAATIFLSHNNQPISAKFQISERGQSHEFIVALDISFMLMLCSDV